MSLQYLPDFSEEYSIQMRSGFGVNQTRITLENGWNLTGLDQELDSQVADQISAVADLLGSAGKIVATAGKSSSGIPPMVVHATHVPLGFYESILTINSEGKKKLAGWRYVGFAPFHTEFDGTRNESSRRSGSDLYGLVFRNGVMTFESMTSIGQRGMEPIKWAPNPAAGLEPTSSVAWRDEFLQQATEVLRHYLGVVPKHRDLQFTFDKGTVNLSVQIPRQAHAKLQQRNADLGQRMQIDLERIARNLTLDSTTRVKLRLLPLSLRSR